MALHVVPASPQTTRIGVFDATIPPVLTVASGDTVVLRCVSGPERVYPPAGSGFTVPPAPRAINEAGPAVHRGHIVTGPVAVERAEPGDTLDVLIEAIELDNRRCAR